ncbi:MULTISPECIES: hypothetical protein [unclassified Streptomyces]|uniref:hypothetical protein n=1 Tax=unclassified Streptomyces TaxID=2593676 RepID=UPI001BE58060|nr:MULTISPECIES: hypothetical protein [unclassified Streptomyces]MBT2402922.1 hypothetical protein [Streptomyces sp. ISL-21]MBT2609575.1 hypothetical protein [Streptomyces sp. ISL-87]
MNTFLDFTVVFLIAALLLAPSLWGVVRDRRIDRELRAPTARFTGQARGPATAGPVGRRPLPVAAAAGPALCGVRESL